MVKLFDLVKVNIPTSGTGDVTFGSSFSAGFFTPSEAGAIDGYQPRYVIVDGDDVELGVGLIKSSVTEMERTVVRSRIGGVAGASKINLSGTAFLAFTASAADILTPGDNLASLVDADAALGNLGGGAKGIDIFKSDAEADVLTVIPSAYHKENVVGTVAFAGGKNTGAVIESGSNANGTYIKWSDGTMICSIYAVVTDQAIANAYGVLYQSTRMWSFPAAFASPPNVQCSNFKWGSSGSWGANGVSGSTSSATLRILDVAAKSAGTNTEFGAFAVGRWRA